MTLVMVPLVLRGPVEGTKIDHASTSSKISATSSGRGVRGGARGTVILSDLRTAAVVVVLSGGAGSGWRGGREGAVRGRGKVGSSCGWGARAARGIDGRGLLARLREMREGGGKRESGRAPVALDEEDAGDGEASDTTPLSSRAYHDTSSSLVVVCSSSNSASVNSSTFAELEFGASSAVEDFVITYGWIFTCLAAGPLRSCGLGPRPGHSSSDVSGVVGMSLLEHADMLVSEGVGERERGGDICRRSRGRVGRGSVVRVLLLLDSVTGGESVMGDVGLMSIMMS